MKGFKVLAAAAIVVASIGTEQPAVGFAKAPDGIAVYMNGKMLPGVNAVIDGGVMYLPFRPLIGALGGEVGYDSENGVTAVIGKETMSFWPDDYAVYYKDAENFLNGEIRRIHGQVHVPARSMGRLLELDVAYDRKAMRADVKNWGYGQDEAVKAVVSSFLDPAMNGSLSELLTWDNPRRDDYEDEPDGYEPPYRTFETWMGDIDYTSPATAVLHAGTRSETQAMKRDSDIQFTLRFDASGWKIAKQDWIHLAMDLPADADETADNLKREHPGEVEAVLRDLNAFYDANNAEDLASTMKLMSPGFLESWKKSTGEDYEEVLKAVFDNGHTTRQIVDSRVLVIDNQHAIVHLNILFNEQQNGESGPAEEPYPYELVAGMDFVDGHWTYDYDDEWDISTDY